MEHEVFFIIAMVAASVAVFTDTKYGLIPNKLTLSALAFGLALHTLTGGWSGLSFSAQGAALGLSLFLLPFLIGGMGAGDVKLLAALGAFIGPFHVLVTFVCSTVLGGVIGACVLVRQYGWQGTYITIVHNWNLLLSPAWRTTRITGFPFASAILFGVFASLFVAQL